LASIDRERRSADIAGQIRSHEQYGLGEIIWISGPAKGHVAQMLAQATFLREFALLGECLRRIGGSRREWPFISFDSIAAVRSAVMVAPGMTALTKIPCWPQFHRH
jgi:hypothetical protein